ncbi:MAG: hypothetical protein H0V22_10300 [Solirubrobacterales bacterium]|nr:hypothetical protein [Solirubrobacterales bacterium]
MSKLLLLIVIAGLAGGWVWSKAASELVTPDARATPRGDAPRRPSERRAPRRLGTSRCPNDLTGCRSVHGRVLFVESVDPDGDGDLHVVVSGAGGVTGPGITSVDVSPRLRPRRDPRIGDRFSAAGQVQRGSFGQSQIHAVEIHVRRR